MRSLDFRGHAFLIEWTRLNAMADLNRRLCIFLILLYTSVAVGAAKEASRPKETSGVRRSGGPKATDSVSDRFFESEIRPLLIQRCIQCHGAEKSEGGLRLDSGQAMLHGGDSGPALVPHDASASLIAAAIRYESLEMPPDERLSDDQQRMIVRWIDQGAKWSESFEHEKSSAKRKSMEPWWASKPLSSHLVSLGSTKGSGTRIDAHIDHRLGERGMRRADPVDRSRLIRRLSFDLLGLPPSPEQVEAFIADTRTDAYERLVDAMMADPAYGERMGRLWLDLVRYAESDGWRQDAYRSQAFRYRQWVVDAFNQGMPYDRFVAMQLAGDELMPHDTEALAAVGFLRLGIFEFNQRDAEGQWQNIVDEMTDVTADVFLATGMACAKCHDHKFDPISRADYFRLRSVFEPLLFVDLELPKASSSKSSAEVIKLRAELEEIEGDAIEALKNAQVKKFTVELQEIFHKPSPEKNSYEQQLSYLIRRQMSEEGASDAKIKGKLDKELVARRSKIIDRLKELSWSRSAADRLLTVRDASGEIRPTRYPGRTSGASFTPGVPGVFGGEELVVHASAVGTEATDDVAASKMPESTGRRLSLASWMTSPDNPIAARVLANRLWQFHFGTGLVSSPNDFGSLGVRPTHPQLLDYLAERLLQTDWNIQTVQKEIVRSATYRQSSVHPNADEYRQSDAANRMLWKYPLRRLDAEQYRDALFVAADALIDRYGGPSVDDHFPKRDGSRRTLYLKRKRNTVDPMLQLLDAASGLVSAAQRDETVTAPQALMMMNSPRMIAIAEQFARRVGRDVAGDDSVAFIKRAHQIIAGTPIDQRLLEMLAEMASSGPNGRADACHVLLNSNAFLFIE